MCHGFLNCIKYHARRQTLQYVHTINLRHQEARRQCGLSRSRLLDLLVLLPNLTSVLVPEFSSLDHASVRRLCHPGQAPLAWTEIVPPWSVPFELKLLDLSGYREIIPEALLKLLSSSPNLLCLDISSVIGLQGLDFWKSLSTSICSLEVLKLRDTNVTDAAIGILVDALGTKTWSLDVRDNKLSDKAALALVNFCFAPPEYSASGVSPTAELSQSVQDEALSYPRNLPAQSAHAQPDIKDDTYSIATWLSRNRTANFLPHTGDGLTHLYISNNGLTVEGARTLLKTSRLRVFDCGQLSAGKLSAPSGHASQPQETTQAGAIRDLLPVIRDCTSSSLSWLRISHHLLTEDTIKQHPSPDQGNSVLPKPYQRAAELGFLDTLVLTNVPSHDSHVAAALISFLTGCAHFDKQAEETGCQVSSPSAQFARDAPRSILHAKHKPKRLRKLQLEISASGKQQSQQQSRQNSRSVTEDADSEVFLQASAEDFSFFAEDPLQPSSEQNHHQQQPPINPASQQLRSPSNFSEPQDKGTDVIAALTNFRNDRRKAAAAVTAATAAGTRQAIKTTTSDIITDDVAAIEAMNHPIKLDDEVIAKARDHWLGQVEIVRLR